ncbi:hypothetical protein, partial [Salmonella enterica subsp. enterica serovar Enteritidis]
CCASVRATDPCNPVARTGATRRLRERNRFTSPARTSASPRRLSPSQSPR